MRNQDVTPHVLVEAADRIQSAIAAVSEGSDAEKADVFLTAALAAIREISALPADTARPALNSVADVLHAFQARIGRDD